MTDPTPEQIAAQALIDAADAWAADPDAVGDNDRDARNWLRERAEALTNPQPALPNKPGVYLDANGDVWWLKEGSWHDEFRSWPDSYVQGFAPFTRLVPERPPITREQVIEAALRGGTSNFGSWAADAILALVNGTDR